MTAPHENAGQPVPADHHTNIPRLVAEYYAGRPDPAEPAQRVAFGTSGHRGSSLDCTFNEAHILAVTQAVCDVRQKLGTSGPLLLGMDTHALSEPAWISALEVLAANGVDVRIASVSPYTPTPVISHAILGYNRGRTGGLCDGIIITPSHNPPTDGGFKYNPPHGGPADSSVTKRIESRANALLEAGLEGVKRVPLSRALAAATTHRYDFVRPYIDDLDQVVDVTGIAAAGLSMGVDPMGGAGVHYWEPLAERWGLNIEVVNPVVDPTFGFMRFDHDGKIRMDCSSPWAMKGLIDLKDRFDVAFGNDPDADRHGIVTPTGLMNPNHYLAAAVSYLCQHRPSWSVEAKIGKTVVTSSMVDRVAASLDRRLHEVPVGFKHFVDGLVDGSVCFGGEESAGASFSRTDGTVWTTDKDGFILNLLAAEMTVTLGRDPAAAYAALENRFGKPVYARIEAPATRAEKAALKQLSASDVVADTLAGDPIVRTLTTAPGNGEAIGGLKVETANGWFAARPSGTEAVYKIYAESFVDDDHLRKIQKEAQELVAACLA